MLMMCWDINLHLLAKYVFNSLIHLQGARNWIGVEEVAIRIKELSLHSILSCSYSILSNQTRSTSSQSSIYVITYGHLNVNVHCWRTPKEDNKKETLLPEGGRGYNEILHGLRVSNPLTTDGDDVVGGSLLLC